MATKTITTGVTLHIKDEARSTPIKISEQTGLVVSGKTVVIAVPPGKPVTLDAAEADRILARFGGEEVVAEAPAKK